jgi:hypothetical protein
MSAHKIITVSRGDVMPCQKLLRSYENLLNQVACALNNCSTVSKKPTGILHTSRLFAKMGSYDAAIVYHDDNEHAILHSRLIDNNTNLDIGGRFHASEREFNAM